MTATPMEIFGSDLQRLRKKLAFKYRKSDAPSGGPELHPPTRGKRGAKVPPRLEIRDVMEGDLATVAPDNLVNHAVALMIANGISSVPVVDAEGRIAGALNEGDLMQVFYDPTVNCVADVMTRNPIVLSIDAAFVDVVDHLMSSDFRRVLIHEDGRLVGVITRSHVMPALLGVLESQTKTDKAH